MGNVLHAIAGQTAREPPGMDMLELTKGSLQGEEEEGNEREDDVS